MKNKTWYFIDLTQIKCQYLFSLKKYKEKIIKMLSAAVVICTLTLLLLNTTCPFLANSVDPDQLASSEANWSGFALFVIKYVNFYQKPGSVNLIAWKLEVGVAS